MASPIEIIAPLVEAIITVAPALLDIPILGRVLIIFAPGGANETKALENLEEVIKKKKTERDDRKKRNARYVIKASEAMQCVENTIMSKQVLFAMVKGLINAITGKPSDSADILVDQIWTCIEQHVLRQDTPRVIGSPRGKYVRPRKGHGHGRGKF